MVSVNRSQLFTIDLLVALIPLTIVIGLSANAISGAISSHTVYISSYENNIIAIDMVSGLTKNEDIGIIATLNPSQDIIGGPWLKQKWTPPPIYKPPPVGPRPMIFTYINTTEWWVPFKKEAVLLMNMVDGRNIIDIATVARKIRNSPTLINGTSLYLLNATNLKNLSGRRPFRVAVFPIYRTPSEISLETISNILIYNYSLIDLDNNGYIEEDESIALIPYAEAGTLSGNLFSVQVPVLFMFDESINLSRYDNFTEEVYDIPVVTDSNGNGDVFVIFDHPQVLNKSWIYGNSFELKRTGIPLPIYRVEISRRHPYINVTDTILNGTIKLYLNSIGVFNGTLNYYENRTITENFIPELRLGANILKIHVEKCMPEAVGHLYLSIKAQDMWVSQRIFMMPANLVVIIGEGRL